MNRHERRAAAKRSSTDQTGRAGASPAALCEAGFRHLRAGEQLEAQTCARQALAIDPRHADSLHLMGLLSFHVKQYDHAVEWVSRAIRQEPRPELLVTLGTTLRQQGRHDEALQTFDKAVQLRPDNAAIWCSLGTTLVELKRTTDAVLAYQQALKLDPRHWDAACNCGLLLQQLERSEEALSCFTVCNELKPDHAPTLQMRAVCLSSLKRFEEALAENRRAIGLDPADADTCNNLGDALQSLGRYEEALIWFDRALALRPGFVHALNNKAFSLGQLQRFAEAFAAYDHLKTLEPDNAVTEWNLALLYMLTGNFEAGWKAREARWKATSLPVVYPKFTQPMWLGKEDVAGKTVLIHVDEGLGDSIQFARYVPMVAARGARVILVVSKALVPLLSGLPGVAQCLPTSSTELPPFDLHCPMSSLPLVFDTRLDSIPAATAYLPPSPPERIGAWEQRLGGHDRLRVGLVWSGNPNHKNDHNRSLPLKALTRILDLDATFVSLQKDPRAADGAALRQRPDIVDLTGHLTDFGDTAALVACLDLVITVDTSVAHLSAALGRPTWILLPFTPDYRWLLGRDDSPWYPTVRLFRQDAARDYAPVLDRVRTELATLIATARSDGLRLTATESAS